MRSESKRHLGMGHINVSKILVTDEHSRRSLTIDGGMQACDKVDNYGRFDEDGRILGRAGGVRAGSAAIAQGRDLTK